MNSIRQFLGSDRGESSNLPIADFDLSSAQIGVPLLMRHQKHGVSTAVDGEQQLHDLVRRLFVKVPGRLVSKEDHWVVDQGAGDGHALSLSAGQLTRQML